LHSHLYDCFFGLSINPSLNIYSNLRALHTKDNYEFNTTPSPQLAKGLYAGKFVMGLNNTSDENYKLRMEFQDTSNYYLKLSYKEPINNLQLFGKTSKLERNGHKRRHSVAIFKQFENLGIKID